MLGSLQKRLDNIQIDLSVQTVEILLQILIAMLKDQCQFLVTVQHVVKPDYIFVLQLLEQAYFSERGRWYTLDEIAEL